MCVSRTFPALLVSFATQNPDSSLSGGRGPNFFFTASLYCGDYCFSQPVEPIRPTILPYDIATSTILRSPMYESIPSDQSGVVSRTSRWMA